jgi:hypothetical protein
MNCHGVKEHLVDFLYDELPPEERAAFTEHVLGCPACKQQVAGFRRTLGNARAALSGPLVTEPPARVHDAVMQAARAAAAEAPVSAPARKPRPVEEPGFFAKLLRAPWILPAFGAVSVATVVLLVRVLKNPEVIPGQRPQSIEERAEQAPAAPAENPASEAAKAERGARPAAPEGRAGTQDRELDRAKTPAAGIARRRGSTGQRAGGQGSEQHLSEEATGGKTSSPAFIRKKKLLDSDSLNGLGLGVPGVGASSAGRFAEPPPPRHVPASESSRPTLEAKRSARPPEPAKAESAPHMRAKESRSADDLMGEIHPHRPVAAPAEMAAPAPAAMAKPAARAPAPTPSAAPPPAPARLAAPAAPTAPDHAAESERPMPSWAQPSAEDATAPAPKPAAAGKAGPAARASLRKSAEEPAEAEHEQSNKDKAAKGQPGPSLKESLRRADRLFASQDWSAAALAYRDLLARFPGHRDASKWRMRMDQALLAEREGREATRAKAAKAQRTGPAAAESARH